MIFLKMTFVHKGEQGYEISLGIVPVNIQQLIRKSKIWSWRFSKHSSDFSFDLNSLVNSFENIFHWLTPKTMVSFLAWKCYGYPWFLTSKNSLSDYKEIIYKEVEEIWGKITKRTRPNVVWYLHWSCGCYSKPAANRVSQMGIILNKAAKMLLIKGVMQSWQTFLIPANRVWILPQPYLLMLLSWWLPTNRINSLECFWLIFVRLLVKHSM